MEHHHHHPDHHKPEPPAERQALQHIGHDGHRGPVNHRAHQVSTGMKQKHGHAGHDHGAMIVDFMRRFWVCLVLSVPVVALSMMFQDVAGYHLDFPTGSRSWSCWQPSSTCTEDGHS